MFRRNSQESNLEPKLRSVPSRSADNFEDWPPQENETPQPAIAGASGAPDEQQNIEMFNPNAPSRNTTVSIVAPNAHWRGTLHSEGVVQIFGRVDGDGIVAVDLLVAAGAEVNASITATNLTIAGKVTGAISCANRFEVLSSGEVHGEVISPAIIVHEGAQVVGMLGMSEKSREERELNENLLIEEEN